MLGKRINIAKSTVIFQSIKNTYGLPVWADSTEKGCDQYSRNKYDLEMIIEEYVYTY
jgi:hypothetical protein